MRISLQTKIFLSLSLLLAISLSAIGYLNLQYLKSETTRNIFELHRAQLEKIRGDIESTLKLIDEKSEWVAQLDARGERSLAHEILRRDQQLLMSGLWTIGSSDFKPIYQRSVSRGESADNLDQALRKALNKALTTFFRKTSPQRISEKAVLLPLEGGPEGMIAYCRPILAAHSMVNQIFVTVIDFSELISFMRSAGPGELALFGAEGQMILGAAQSHQTFSALFQKASSFPANNSTLEYVSAADRYLGGFQKIGSEWTLLSALSEERAFAGLKNLSEKIWLMTLMTLTMAFMVSVMFAHSLSRPLKALVERMKLVGEGDLHSPVVVKSRDEIYDLSISFSEMIAEVKDSRDRLEETNRNLESRVIERTLELEKQNRVVKETQEALLRTTRLASAGEVAGRAAHEVLNPLTSLMARLDVVEDRIGKETSELKSFLAEICGAWEQDYRQGGFNQLISQWQAPSKVFSGKNLFQEDLENLQQIENSILTVASRGVNDLQFIRSEAQRIHKIVNGMRKLNQPQSDPRSHSLHSIIQDAKLIMQDLFEKRGLTIQLDLSALQDRVRVDKDELLQAMTNLMRNSLHSMMEKQKQNPSQIPLNILLKTYNKSTEIYLEIQDQGLGISSENQAKLFEKQFSTKGSEEGTGLGLSISRRLMRSNQSDIEFVSSGPDGTTFRFRIPIDSSQQGVAA